MNIITYDRETGAVISVISGSASPPAYYETTIVGALASDAPVGGTICPYIVDGVLHSAPPAPTPAHTWDWATKQWTLSLESAKEAKWTAVKGARDSSEFGPFTWSGHTFDGDRDAQRRLTVALEAAKEAIVTGAPFSTFWKLADNSIVTLSAQDVVDVYRACGEHNIRDNHAEAAVKYAQIQAATTIEELEAI